MNKIVKILAILAGLALLVSVAGALILKKMFPPEKIKALITEQVKTKLHREVKLGEVSIGLFRGVSIGDFALSESPDFSRGTFVESKGFILKFQLLPLLSKKVVMDQVKLDRPKIRILRNADGKTYNFSDLAAPAAPNAAAQAEQAAAPSQPMALTIAKAQIVDGRVEFLDKSAQRMKLVLSPINLTVLGTGLDKPMAVALSVKLESALLGKELSGSLESKSVVDLQGQRVRLESFRWKMNALTLDLKGTVANFSRPDLDLTASLHDLNLEELAPWASLPKALRLSGQPEIGLDLKGGLDDLKASLKLDLTQAGVAYADLFQKGAQTAMSLDFEGTIQEQKRVSINAVEFKLASLEATLKGEVDDLHSTNPNLKVEISLRPFELKDLASLSKLAAPYDPAGKVSLSAKASGPLKLLKVGGALGLENVQAKVDKYNLSALTGKAEFTDSSLSIPKLTGKLGGEGKEPASFQIQTAVRNFQQPDIALNADFSALDLGLFAGGEKKGGAARQQPPAQPGGKAAQAPYKGPVIKAAGRVTVGKVLYTKFEADHAEVAWNLTGITPVLDRINGTAEFKAGPGKIHQIPLLSALAPLLKLDPSGLVFSRVGGHWNVAQGTAKTEDFQMNSQAADLYAKGTLHLPDNRPDLVLTAKLPKGSIGGTVGELSSDESGRPTFVFRLKNDWKPTLDASQTGKKAVEKATEEIKKKASDVLQEQGQKLLDGLFKH